jgi:biofilm PGA synthesis N-glycosyltransferase PgaC
MIDMIIISLFSICAILQIAYWLILFSRLAFFKEKENSSDNLPQVSIVICAYNEANNLKKYLPEILEQDYPSFEVLVVNDDSNDGSSEILEDFKQQYPHLSILSLSYPNGKKNIGKKNALSEGIKKAKHEILLLTDADCHPQSNQWTKKMIYTLSDSTSIGLGYGPYEKKKGLLNAFVRFETVYTAIQYMSFSLWGIPYMGVGRNMIYKKELFFQVGGFEQHSHIASGDDDLFINAVANKNNTAIVINEQSQMYSAPKETWYAYFKQKSRHVTTGRHYKWIHKILLGLLSLSHFGIYFFALLSIIFGSSTFFVLSSLLVIISLKSIVFALIAKKLKEGSLIPLIPLLDVIYVLYYILLAPALMWGKTAEWK